MSQFHRDQASDSNEVVIPLMLDGTYPMITPGLDWTRLFMSLTAGAGTRCMSLLPDSPTLVYFISLDELERKREKDTSKAFINWFRDADFLFIASNPETLL